MKNINKEDISVCVGPGSGHHQFLSKEGVVNCISCECECCPFCAFGSSNNVCVECHLAELAVPTKMITNDITTEEMRLVLIEMSYQIPPSTPLGEIVNLYDALVTRNNIPMD
jgi:hypothetical protein